MCQKLQTIDEGILLKNKNNLLYKRSPRPIQYLITVAVLLLCITATAPAQTAEQIAEKALAATVYLEMKDSTGKTLGFGSGFFVRENLIATNYHVIEGAAQGTAKLVGKYTTYTIEGFTATDKINDLALLKVTAYSIKPLRLGMSSDVKIGETVYVAGNPKGLEGTFSDGIISSKRGGYSKERLQMTAPISPGSSGGPALNRKGEVIGVSFMTIEGGQNLNFAIPSKYLRVLLAKSKPAKPLSQGSQSISAETYFMWGNTMHALELYKEAITAYDKAIRLKPDYAKAYNNRGAAKGSLGQYNTSIADCNQALRLKPDLAEAYNNRGIAKADLGQHSAAITDFDKAIQLKPDYANAYLGRGSAKSNLGQYFVAVTDFDKAIRLKPDFAQAYYNRGTAKLYLRRYSAAIENFDKTIHLTPNFTEAYINRGSTKTLLGQYEGAILDFDKAIQLKPDFANGYSGRGAARYALGRVWEAKSDFQTALRLAKQAGDENLKILMEEALQSFR